MHPVLIREDDENKPSNPAEKALQAPHKPLLIALLLTYLMISAVIALCFANADSKMVLTVGLAFRLLIGGVIFVLFATAYVRTAYTPIAFVAPPDVEQVDAAELEHCEICHQAKPRRSHHCRHCGQCVLMLDHHCPALDTCVGVHNFRFFVQAFLYSSLLGLFTFVAFASSLSGLSLVWKSVALLHILMSVGVVIGAALFLRKHIWLLLRNLTSVEYAKMVFEWSQADYFDIDSDFVHSFDFGAWRNVVLMLGSDSVLHWLLPLPNNDRLVSASYRLTPSPDAEKRLDRMREAVDAKLNANLVRSGLLAA